MHVPGIEERHQRRCASRDGGACDCQPSYRAWYWDRELQRQRWSPAFKSLAEARAYKLRQDPSGPVLSAAPTVAEFAESFIEALRSGRALTRNRTRYKPKTARGYEWALRKYVVVPRLGDLPLDTLTARILREWVEEMVLDDFSSAQIAGIFSPLRVLFSRALDEGLIDRDPMAGVKLPPTEYEPVQEEDIVTPEEARDRLALLPLYDRAIWGCLFFAGLRIGEVRALCRGDVLFEGKAPKLSVRGGWDDYEGFQSAKTRAGKRRPVVVPDFVPLLNEYLAASEGTPADLLFPPQRKGHGASFDPKRLRERTYATWAEHGYAPIKPHIARHTYASWFIGAGVPLLVVSRFMGHSSVRVTERVYVHLLPSDDERTYALLRAYSGAT